MAPADFVDPISRNITTSRGPSVWSFQNVSVEMETGTGKTYVYVRTILELARRYGLCKYIVVVPSLAIREGVLKTLTITRKHFEGLFDGIAYRYFKYNADQISLIRDFALSDCVEIMVMTVDSFNRASNVIARPSDTLQGEHPLHLIQETHPILVLDEPQNMETEAAIQALATLAPLLTLRYSATHRNTYNQVYRLSPIQAYREHLVKQVEVASVESERDANHPFLQLLAVRETRRSCSARLTAHVLRPGGGVRDRTFTVRSGTSLEVATGRPEYSGYTVDEINPATQELRFTNNVAIGVGETRGADRSALFDSQIRYTIREHFMKQARLRQHGIKVISLFFVDRVSSYVGGDPVVRNLFDRAFDQIKTEFAEWRDLSADEVRVAYFASRPQGQRAQELGGPEFVDSRTGATDADRSAYELIMRDKERLLAFDEKAAFVFSHSALREGWDNPNIFQICTLNQSISELRKRQEIGRGVRLAVDQSGNRSDDPSVNVLTVIANESYERYVAQYQSELVAEYGEDVEAPRFGNARERTVALLRPEQMQTREFVELWDKICRRTRYTVKVDTEALLARVVPALNQVPIRPIRIRASKARLVTSGETFSAQTLAGPRTVSSAARRGTVSGIVETMANLLEQTSPPFYVTRRTLFEIFRRSENKRSALANPHEFASSAVALIREHLAEQMVADIQYEQSDQSYAATEFRGEVATWSDRVVPAKRCVYDKVIVESGPERDFVASLERDDRTRLYMKVPSWFTVKTPVGEYNPDWAIVREVRDQHGAFLHLAYVVAETKSTLLPSKLRPAEYQKVRCGEKHFIHALEVAFEVVRSVPDLDRGD